MRDTRKKILCIEDDRETAELIAEELVDRGFDVEVAYGGSEGYATILRSLPDLVLSDIRMPAVSGFDLLERLTAAPPRFRNMPFVFLTAMTDRDIELKARQLGADDFITKPVDFDLLEAIIGARLAGVARNEKWPKLVGMTDREGEALTWAARGKTSTEIAMISRPVEAHRRFSYRQRPDQAWRHDAHRGGDQGCHRPIDPSLGASRSSSESRLRPDGCEPARSGKFRHAKSLLADLPTGLLGNGAVPRFAAEQFVLTF
jgi:DNA-binding response OmpR family regulator